MRITDYPILSDIKEEYIHLRREGKSRHEAEQMLISSYKDELTTGAEDDGLLFWIGLADAQYAHKELSGEVSKQALTALASIQSWGLSPGDLERRAEKYQQAPMPEKTFRKPRGHFICPWEIGDTFAYKLSGPDAEQYGIDGKYALLRKVGDTVKNLKGPNPIVTVTLWDGPLPTSEAEFIKAPFMKLCCGGRMWSPIDKYEYRAKLVVNTKQQLETLNLIYVGRFLNVPMPVDEIVFEEWAVVQWLVYNTINKDIAMFYKMHCAIANGFRPKLDPVLEWVGEIQRRQQNRQ